MALHTWLIYLVAALALSLAPGPNGLLALTNGALYGLRKTLFTVSGGALGFILLIGLSMAGIGTLLQTSASLLVTMKWLGGAYLIWLGVHVWHAPAPNLEPGNASRGKHGFTLFRQGFLAAVSNPKAILFFSALLTQFIDPQRSLFMQFVIMAATFVIMEFITEVLIANMASRVRGWLQRSGRRFNQACGGVFILIGGWLPLSR